jgi:hypothetical protein
LLNKVKSKFKNFFKFFRRNELINVVQKEEKKKKRQRRTNRDNEIFLQLRAFKKYERRV